MRHDRSRYQQHTQPPLLINLTPFGWLDFKYWLVAVALTLVLLIGLVFGLPAFAADPNSSLAQLYQRSLGWATLGQNAPLSHFPLATALSYLAALSLGLLLGLLLLMTQIELDLRRLVQIWRADFSVLFAAISLAGIAVLASVLIKLPFADLHFLSLQTHHNGVLHGLLVSSLQSRWGLLAVSLFLLVCTLLVTAVSVLAPCLSNKAARHDLLVDD
ncbi:MAG: hypothetical protein WA154_09250 [Moraxellaceae bacterium]